MRNYCAKLCGYSPNFQTRFSPFILKMEHNLHHVHLAEHHNLRLPLHPPHSYLHPHCTIMCVCMGIIVHHNPGRIKHHKSLASHPVFDHFKNTNMEGEEGVDTVQWRLFLFLSITARQQLLVSTVIGHCNLPLLPPCSCTRNDHYY